MSRDWKEIVERKHESEEETQKRRKKTQKGRKWRAVFHFLDLLRSFFQMLSDALRCSEMFWDAFKCFGIFCFSFVRLHFWNWINWEDSLRFIEIFFWDSLRYFGILWGSSRFFEILWDFFFTSLLCVCTSETDWIRKIHWDSLGYFKILVGFFCVDVSYFLKIVAFAPVFYF